MITQRQFGKKMNRVIVFITAMLLVFVTVADGAVFTATSSGNWSSSATWGGGDAMPGILVTDDQILIPAGIIVYLDQDITVKGPLSNLIVNGELYGSDNSLSLSNGKLSGSGQGNINIESISFSGVCTLFFTGNLHLHDFTNSCQQLYLFANTIIVNSLNLKSGVLTIAYGGNLTLQNGCIVNVSGGKLDLNGGLFTALDTYNINYSGSSAIIGAEASASGLKDINVNLNGDSRQLIMADNLNLYGQFAIQLGELVMGTHSLSANGISTASSGLINSTGESSIFIFGNTNSTLRFKGSLPTLGNLNINTGNLVRTTLESDLWVSGDLMSDDLNLASGTIDLNGHTLSVSGDINLSVFVSFIGGGNSSLEIHSDNSVNGKLKFADGAGQLKNLQIDIGSGGDVILGSDLSVSGILDLDDGFVILRNNNLSIAATGEIMGGSPNTYIIAEGSGMLEMTLLAGGHPTVYPVGTMVSYSPATLAQATGSASGKFRINLIDQVYSDGTSGYDLTATTTIVERTWRIESDLHSRLNLSLSVEWGANLEANYFDNINCFISHFINGNWDAHSAVTATVAESGNYTVSRSGITSLSPFAIFDTGTTLGTKTAKDENNIMLIPNPANDFITINMNEAKNYDLYIYDYSGRFISEQHLTETRKVIDISSLAPGVYLFKIWNNDYVRTTKIVKE